MSVSSPMLESTPQSDLSGFRVEFGSHALDEALVGDAKIVCGELTLQSIAYFLRDDPEHFMDAPVENLKRGVGLTGRQKRDFRSLLSRLINEPDTVLGLFDGDAFLDPNGIFQYPSPEVDMYNRFMDTASYISILKKIKRCFLLEVDMMKLKMIYKK